jgi:hypothetical protein
MNDKEFEMKHFMSRIAIALLITALAGVAVMAKTRRQTVSFPANINIAGTLVKKGTYFMKFDDKTGELVIESGSKVVARAKTTAADRASKSKGFSFRSKDNGAIAELLGVTFEGANQDYMISGTSASR